MATYTTNYNLEKPAQTDIYNVDVFNANADKIDAGLTDKAEKTMLAPVETTNSASRSYAKGEYFVYNNVLCCATTAIAAGGTIAIGTNCSTAPVGGELKSLRDALPKSTIVTIAAQTLTAGQTTNDLIITTSETVLSITPIWESSSDIYMCNVSLYRYQSTNWYARIRNIGTSSVSVPAIKFYIVTIP